METIDIIILIAFLAGALMGALKGFIRQLASLLGLVVGLMAAKMLYGVVAEKYFSHLTDSLTVAQILSFVAIWMAVPLLFTLVAVALTKAMEAIRLGWLNRWLGSGLGALKALILVGLVIGAIEFVDRDCQLIHRTKKEASLFYYPIEQLAGIFMPAVSRVAQELVNEGGVNQE